MRTETNMISNLHPKIIAALMFQKQNSDGGVVVVDDAIVFPFSLSLSLKSTCSSLQKHSLVHFFLQDLLKLTEDMLWAEHDESTHRQKRAKGSRTSTHRPHYLPTEIMVFLQKSVFRK